MRIAALIAVFVLFFCSNSFAAPRHAIAMHGQPKYKSDFSHFDYVNPNAPKGGDLRLHAFGSFDSLNPFVAKGTAAAGLPFAGQGLLYEPLMVSSYDEPFTMYCLICKTVNLADDKKSVSFEIRKNAAWHDGKPITARDVKWSFNTLMEHGSPFFRAYYSDVQSVGVKNGLVTFYFKTDTNAELPLIIGQMPILPSHAYDVKNTLDIPLGSGAYKIESIDAGRSITYKKADDWWGADLPVNRGRYNFDKITYDYYRDDNVALEAFLAGAYDARLENSAQNWNSGYETNAVKDGRIVKLNAKHKRPQGMSGFVFNTRRSLFDDIEVRKAISKAFDFNWSNKALAHGAYKRSYSYFSNSELAAIDAPEPLEFDLGAASRQLSNAGWKVGKDGIREKDGQKLKFEILLNSPAIGRWAAPFVSNLNKIGVKANIRTVDSATYQMRLNDFDFDMVFESFGQSSSPGNEQLDFWGSSRAQMQGSRNYAGVDSKKIDEIIQGIINAKSRDDLIRQCRALDKELLGGAYIVNGWYLDYWRIAFWGDKLTKPQNLSPLTPAISDTWWSAGISPLQ